MSGQPRTRYAKSGEVHIAYQVVGEGPIDIVFPPAWFSNIEILWEWPEADLFLRRLAAFSRVIIFDQRGTGMSDPIPLANPPMLEERMDDIRAVMDAANSEVAAVLGTGTGGSIAALFAAAHPERTRALILYNTTARALRAPDYEIGIDPSAMEGLVDLIATSWGREEGQLWQGRADESMRRKMAQYQRMSMSPATAAAQARMQYSVDIRDALPAIRVPALIMHRAPNTRGFPPVHGRYLATRIPGARYVEIPETPVAQAAPHNTGIFWMVDSDPALGEIEEFLTGVRPASEPARVLATVLFTDIVHSTETAAGFGDKRWLSTLTEHEAAVRRQVERHSGRIVQIEGDSVLAIFDGPGRAIRCAFAMRDSIRSLGVEVRSGLHAGEIELRGNHIGGIAVHIGARVMALAGAGEVLASSTVRDLVIGSGMAFEDRDSHQLKGVPGQWRIYAVVG